MSRATLVYLVMLVACAGGLWLIIRAGSGLAAPADLSGVWRVGGEDPALPARLGETLRVEQSGRYFRLTFERGLQVDLKLIAERRPRPDAGDGLELTFQGPAWTLTTVGADARGPLIFRLDGRETHTFTATRGAAADAEGGQAAAAAPAQTANAGTHAP